MPLDGTHRAAQSLGQGLHREPADAGLVVSVVGEGAVGGDRLDRDFPGRDAIAGGTAAFTGKKAGAYRPLREELTSTSPRYRSRIVPSGK
jgi:hypothetical protein